ncbi:MAG: GPI transamidase component [Cirrosporium novae-zelandiae]|nr:MAG: GPI transamidase component [Cirrosporium novae-zelandiae]
MAGDGASVEKPAIPVASTPTTKKPPPESAESIRTRTCVILTFWVVIIFLGLPIWWKTTSIYRARLPLHDMMEWADGKACRPVFPLKIAVEAPWLQPSEAQHLVRTTQHALDDLNEFSAHHLRLQLADTETSNHSTQVYSSSSIVYSTEAQEEGQDTTLMVKLLPVDDTSTPRAALEAYNPVLNVLYSPNQIPSSSASISPLASFIANQLQKIFEEEQATIAYILSASNTGYIQTNQPPVSPELATALSRRSTRALKYAPTYHLTISLFTPTYAPSSWDIEEIMQSTVNPLVSAFSSISNFTIDTQLQLYASPSPSTPEPVFSEELQAFTLQQPSLSGFINAAEWPLSPSIGSGPTINLVVYVPPPNLTPLTISPSNKTSWLIPQWGAVSILNIPPHHPPHLDKADLLPPLQTLTTHLLTLLGLPSTPSSLPLRLSSLTRTHTLTLLLSSSSTLGSLARLTQSLPSIPIPRTVAASVRSTLSHLSTTCSDLTAGRFRKALQEAREAERESESAFFEKSMVGQVYFPEEHKVAVYLPLLGPMGVPLCVALLKEVGRWVGGWRRGIKGGEKDKTA